MIDDRTDERRRGRRDGPRYRTSLDRAGLAIGTGGLIGGLLAAVLTATSGRTGAPGVILALAAGTAMTALGITALAVLPWAMLHIAGRRGPVSAALLGAGIGFVLFLGGLTYGFGLGAMPALDPRTQFFRWASAIATSLVSAAVAAVIALAMWRVAYRRAA